MGYVYEVEPCANAFVVGNVFFELLVKVPRVVGVDKMGKFVIYHVFDAFDGRMYEVIIKG